MDEIYPNNNPLSFNFNNFKEIIELLPKIQEANDLGMERELKKKVPLKEIIATNITFINRSFDLFRGKWTINILYMINFLEEPYFNDLRSALPEINTRTLTNRLMSLRKFGLIERIVHDTRPVRVSYKLTSFGMGLSSLLSPIVVFVALQDESETEFNNNSEITKKKN
ncbi:MAG: winged helix-turn-helix transcriptional regulator [Promethearchaeota archaeon]